MAHVTNYVTIQRARFGARFTFDCDVPAELMSASVVKLSLQPLVENAISHGLDRRRDGLAVVVRACCDETALHIQVADNGYGIDAQTLARLEETLAYPLATAGLPTADVGIGIVNIDRRMKAAIRRAVWRRHSCRSRYRHDGHPAPAVSMTRAVRGNLAAQPFNSSRPL